jgi:adenylate cyclase
VCAIGPAYHNGGMPLADERRLVTVLFADLVGFTGRAERTDPEAVRETQRAYFAAVSREVERYGGSVEKYIGDAVMAIFGAPQAHDDDAERALRAALRVRQVVGELAPDLQVRIGVNTGEVVGGPGTGPHADEYTVSGDAVNVAARLQQLAQPNEIYVGSTTRRLSADAFTFAPLPEQALKGRSDAAEAWRLERELPERPRLRGGEARLVGRTRELAAIQAALEEASQGRGLLIALVGEAGIGKSRLALEARQRGESEGFGSVWATSRSYSAAFPYFLVAQLVGQFLQRTDGDAVAEALRRAGVQADDATMERWSAVLEDVLGHASDDQQLADLTPAGRQRILVQALTALLRAASAHQPRLVVVDDLHWADPASLAVLEELLDVVPELRVAILALYRSGWSHGWEGKSSYEQLNLRPLRLEEARRLADQIAPGTHLSAELTERVLERSGGNPFFLEELMRGEGEAGTDARHRLPETVHEMLLARLDALPSAAKQALQLASVIGMEFGEEIASALATDGNGDVGESLRTLQRAELIVARGDDAAARTFAFRHPLIHEVAYRSLLLATRRALHGRIARWLEEHGGEEEVAALARHYRDSDDSAKARVYLPLAGRRAEGLNANREARGWFLDAAEAFTDDPVRRGEMIEAAARQTYLVGEVADAMQLLSRAIELYESAGAEVRALDARRGMGRYHWLQGDPVEAERQIGLAITGLEQLPPSPELAFAYSFRSQILMLRPDYPAAAKWARKAIAVGEATGATGALVHAYNNLGASLTPLGDPSGLDYLRRSLELAIEHGMTDDAGRAYSNISGQGSQIFPFSYEESEAFLQEALDYAQRTIPGGVFDQWIRTGHVEFLLAAARWSEAERAMDEVDWSRAGAYIQGAVAVLRSLLASYRGRYDDALALVAGPAEAAVRIGDQQAYLPALAALGQAQVGSGDAAAVVSALQRAIELRGSSTEGVMSSWFLFEATDAVTSIIRHGADPRHDPAATGGVELLSRFASRIAPDAALPGPSAQMAVRRALVGAAAEQLTQLCGLLGLTLPVLEAEIVFPGRADAADTVEREHRLFDAARIRLWLGEERGDRAMLDAARATFEALGAQPFIARSASTPEPL